MGIHVMVNIGLVCDSCGNEIGSLHTSKADVPVYAKAIITCKDCLADGIKHPSGSSGPEITQFVEKNIEEAKKHVT